MTGRLLLSVPGGGLPPCFSPDDRLLGGTNGSEVELWEIGASTVCRVLCAPTAEGEVDSAAFSADGRFLASSGSGGVRFWDCALGQEVAHLLIGPTRAVLFHPTDGSLFTSGNPGVHRWPITADPDSGHGLRIGPPRVLGAARETWKLDLSRDGRSLVVVDRVQAQALVLDPAGGEPVRLRPHLQIARTAISPDGRWVATSTYAGRQSTIKIWDVTTGKAVRDLQGENLNGDAWVGFSPDGRWFVLGTFREYRFYEVGSWKQGRTYPRERADLSAAPLAFAPDGKVLAILQNPRLVQLLDVATGQELASLASAEPGRIGYLAFSPDGGRLAVACADGVLQVWDLRSLRRQLADVGLDWDLPPYSPVDRKQEPAPLQIQVDLGSLAPAPK
jgi:WD40 repeat protein